MTRKECDLIADAIRLANLASEDARRVIAEELAEALYRASGYDVNGNRRFKPDRFLARCGVQ